MRNGLISVDAYKKSRAFYIYERKLRYCIEVFFRVRKRASGNASMEKVLCVSVLVKFPRAETWAFLPQWKAGLRHGSGQNRGVLGTGQALFPVAVENGWCCQIHLCSLLLQAHCKLLTSPHLISWTQLHELARQT